MSPPRPNIGINRGKPQLGRWAFYWEGVFGAAQNVGRFWCRHPLQQDSHSSGPACPESCREAQATSALFRRRRRGGGGGGRRRCR
eukprot:scaffold3978_cov112-Isochrysis_galbana.AAC.5